MGIQITVGRDGTDAGSYFALGFFANVPNGATSNFGTLVVQGLGFDTFRTTLLQVPYGMFIAIMM